MGLEIVPHNAIMVDLAEKSNHAKPVVGVRFGACMW